jgi:hypothetical protein
MERKYSDALTAEDVHAEKIEVKKFKRSQKMAELRETATTKHTINQRDILATSETHKDSKLKVLKLFL